MSRPTNSLKYIFFSLVVYLALALIWWSVLLLRENQERHDIYEAIVKEQITNQTSPHLQEIRKMDLMEIDFARKRYRIMILSEAFVILLGLFVSAILIQRAYKRVLHSEKMRRNFLSSVTHELKSPMASIKLAFESLKRLFPENEKAKEVVSYGVKESDRLIDLVNDILLSTRLDDKYHPQIMDVDIHKVTQNIIRDLELKYEGAQIAVQNNINLNVKIDRTAFEAIFRNILENSLKYSGEQKKVEIKLSNSDSIIFTEIEDNGFGIPLNEHEKIFDRFYRIGSEEHRKTKGTGLGLFIVKKLIESNLGKITIDESHLGGTKMRFELPIIA